MLKTIARYSSALSLEEVGGLSALRAAALREEDMVIDDRTASTDSYDYETLGNLSYQQRSPLCEGCFCAASCPDQHFLQRVVRWVKIIARSKQLMTVVFGIVPLLVGLAMGLYLGRKWEQRRQKQQQLIATKQQLPEQAPTVLDQCLPYLVVRILWLRSLTTKLAFFVATAQWLPSKQSSESDGLKKSTAEEEEGKLIPVNYQEEAMEEEERLLLLRDRRHHYRESGVDPSLIPQHIAFIMDGNRRYGTNKYKSVSRGHADGGYKLRDMVHWCLEECVREITVYAFSTENWNRSPSEIDALMAIFCEQCEELRKESVKLQIVVRVLSTDTDPVSARTSVVLSHLVRS